MIVLGSHVFVMLHQHKRTERLIRKPIARYELGLAETRKSSMTWQQLGKNDSCQSCYASIFEAAMARCRAQPSLVAVDVGEVCPTDFWRRSIEKITSNKTIVLRENKYILRLSQAR